MTLRTLSHGNYGRFLNMGNAGFISSNRSAHDYSGGDTEDISRDLSQLLRGKIESASHLDPLMRIF